MVKRVRKDPKDGMYHIKGRRYKMLVGSRAQVWHRTAHQTPGGLTRDALLKSHGRIVSKKKHLTAKKEKRLEKHGYTYKKGHFGPVKMSSSRRSSRSSRSRRGGTKRRR